MLEDGDWVDNRIIKLVPYDAGTGSGETYGSADDATEPPQLIMEIQRDPLAVDGVVAPLGTFTFTRI